MGGHDSSPPATRRGGTASADLHTERADGWLSGSLGSRNPVRLLSQAAPHRDGPKIVRGDDGAVPAVRANKIEFKYERGVQPTPKLGDWVEVLTEILELEAKLPKRERRFDAAAVRGAAWAR